MRIECCRPVHWIFAVDATGISHVPPPGRVRPRKGKRGSDLISNGLPFGRLYYTAIECAKFRSRSHHAVLRVYDESGNVIKISLCCFCFGFFIVPLGTVVDSVSSGLGG